MIRWFLKTCLMVPAAAVILGGCAYLFPDPNQLPRWAERGSGAYKQSGDRVFTGVGSASNPGDRTPLKNTADTRARAGVGLVVGEFVPLMAEEYVRSIYGDRPGPQRTSELRRVTLALQLTVKVKFPGGEIVDRWIAPDGKRTASLCRLSLAEVIETVEADPRLEDGLKNFFKKKAAKVHDMTAARLKKNPVLVLEFQESEL